MLEQNPGAGFFSPRESNRNPLSEERAKFKEATAGRSKVKEKKHQRDDSIPPTDKNTASEKEYVSDIGRNLMKQQTSERQQLKKKRTLHIYDFKKFKYMREDDVKKRYTFGRKLGQGAFGSVCVCTHNASGREFAVKIMTKKQIEKHKIYVKLL